MSHSLQCDSLSSGAAAVMKKSPSDLLNTTTRVGRRAWMQTCLPAAAILTATPAVGAPPARTSGGKLAQADALTASYTKGVVETNSGKVRGYASRGVSIF